MSHVLRSRRRSGRGGFGASSARRTFEAENFPEIKKYSLNLTFFRRQKRWWEETKMLQSNKFKHFANLLAANSVTLRAKFPAMWATGQGR